MLNTFSFGYLLMQKSPTAEIVAVGIYSIGKIVPTKYMPIISADGLFCVNKFEDHQTRKCSTFFRMSKLTKPYFRMIRNLTDQEIGNQ